MNSPLNPTSILNPTVIDERFEQIKQQNLTAAQEADLKSTARDLKKNAVILNDDLHRKLHEQINSGNHAEALETSNDLNSVRDTIEVAAKFSEAVDRRFRNLSTRKNKLTDAEKRKIYHDYHGNEHITQDMLANDYRKPQSSIQKIVKSDPSEFLKE